MSETFVDVPKNSILAPEMWSSLSYNQMLEVKTQIMDKMQLAHGNQLYLKPLARALATLDELLAQKLNDPRGLG